jgi:dipeptidase E
MRLLLISNSTNAGEQFLQHAEKEIQSLLGKGLKKITFVPYAGVTINFDDYTAKVAEKFGELGYDTESVHLSDNPAQLIKEAEAIVIGGGNTFQMADLLQQTYLIQAIRERVADGIPYIGWSAGANAACPTIKTTNDMPIVQPQSFSVLNLVPFQINPHYLDANPEGHAGETREMRLAEFLVVNPEAKVVGLRESTMLKLEGRKLSLIGPGPARILKKGEDPKEIAAGGDLSFLMAQ